LPRHVSAFLRACTAFLRALRAMRVPEHFALLCARIADGSAQPAMLLCEPGIGRHARDRHFAHPRALRQHFDALRSGLHVRLIEASLEAFVTRLRAPSTRGNTALESVRHIRYDSHKYTLLFQ